MTRLIARILKKEPHCLRLRFSDGSIRELDLEPESHRGPAFAMLVDPDYVRGVRRAWEGYLLEWPDGMTWSAAAVWKRSKLVRPGDRQAHGRRSKLNRITGSLEGKNEALSTVKRSP